MKRLKLQLLAAMVCLLLAFPVLSAYSASTNIFPLTDANRIEIFKEFTLTIKISLAEDLFGYTFDFAYPRDKVDFISITEGDFLKQNNNSTLFEKSIQPDSGSIKVASAIAGRSQGASGDGVLATLTFKTRFVGKGLFRVLNPVGKNSRLEDISITGGDIQIEVFEVEEIPILSVEPKSLDFGSVKFGDTPVLSFHIKNTGQLTLNGEVSSLVSWLTVSPPQFVDEAEIKVTLLSHQLAPNDSYEGEVKVRSNAGDFSLFVKAYIVQIVSKDPPPLTILTPDPELLTREKRLFILCETSPVAFASINDQRVAVDSEDGIFFLNIFLKEGLNQIKVSVWDAYENKKTETILATLDTTPPNITVDNIPLFSNSDTLIITGKTDQDAELTFNFAPLLVGKDGVFSISYKAYQTINQLIFTAVDSLGNKRSAIRVFFYKPLKPNQIILTLGERIGTFNDREFTMDAPPMMSNGRVMVPLRLIADIFGADVLWESSKKQVEIELRFSKIVLKVGSNQAVMNGKTTTLDAPPIIQNGRVMVPIRFISEAFSSEVEWKQEEKRVIIRF
ncbi:hypothetical protein LLG10_03980 [bacterium]|nr:hypothetical protein [bacterium]